MDKRQKSYEPQGLINDLSLDDFQSCVKIDKLGEEFFLRVNAAEVERESEYCRERSLNSMLKIFVWMMNCGI